MDPNVWGNATANDLIQDSKKALNALMQQPEVDSEKISVIGHSEGTIYAPMGLCKYQMRQSFSSFCNRTIMFSNFTLSGFSLPIVFSNASVTNE